MKRLPLWLLAAALPALPGCFSPFGVGDRHYQAGDYLSAHEAYEIGKTRSSEPPDAETCRRIEKARLEAARQLHRQALERADQGDLNGAIELLERARRINPQNLDVQDALERTGREKTAALRRADDSYRAALEPAASKDWTAALALYDQAISANRNHLLARSSRHHAAAEKAGAEVLFAEGRRLSQERRLETAVLRFEAVRGRWPFHPEAETSLLEAKLLLARAEKLAAEGDELAAEGRAGEALERFDQALSLHPFSRVPALSRIDLLRLGAARIAELGYAACETILDAEASRQIETFRDEAGAQDPSVLSRAARPSRGAGAVLERNRYRLGLAAGGSDLERPFAEAFARALAERWTGLRPDASVEVLPAGGESAAHEAPAPEFILRARLDGPRVSERRERKPLEKPYIAGYREEPNPDYPSRLEEARAAGEAYERALAAHRRQAEEASRSAAGSTEAAVLASVAGALGELTLPEKATLDRARALLASTPETIRVPITAVHRYAQVFAVRRAELKVSWEVTGPGIRREGSEAFEKSSSGSCFENPRPDLGIPDTPLELAGEEALRRELAGAAREQVARKAEEALRQELCGLSLALAEEARRAGDPARAAELAADAWAVWPAEAGRRLREMGLGEFPLEGPDPAAFDSFCEALRRSLFPPPAGFQALLGTREAVPRTAPEAPKESPSKPARKSPSAAPGRLELLSAAVRPDPVARGAEAELLIRYQAPGGEAVSVEERRLILHRGVPVEGMPLNRIFRLESKGAAGPVESVYRLTVPAEDIPTGEYELEVHTLAGSVAATKKVRFTVR